MAKKYYCPVCGYESDEPIDVCPVCGAKMAVREEGETSWAAEHKVGIIDGVSEEIVNGLRENFQGECTAVISDYTGYMIFVFENGKLAKVDMASYATKTNRKKLINAYSNKSPLAQAIYIKEDTELVICSSSGRMLLVNTGAILPKTTKDTQGISAMKLKKTHKVVSLHIYQEGEFEKAWRFRAKNLPAAGALPSENDVAEQITF